MLVDSHCHLDMLGEGAALDDVLARARAAGVGTLVTICTRLSEFERVRAIAERYDEVYCSVGVHPHDAAAEGQETPERLVALAAGAKVVGIGESGLDYHYDNSPRAAQCRSFRAHAAAAREAGLPLIVHAREADAETARILREARAEGPLTGVLHCFTAGPELARAALEIGFYISLSGIVTFKNAGRLRETVREIPHERLLIETDAPYLAPEPKRGKANEPAFVAHTAAFLADFLGYEADAFARLTTDNFFRLFAKAAHPAARAP